MTTITVAAADSATAMEQIADQLGKDAYILETAKENGLIKILATNDPASARKRARPARPKSGFAPIFESKMLADRPNAAAADFSGGAHFPHLSTMATGELADQPEQMPESLTGTDKAGMDKAGLAGLKSEMHQLREMLEGMMITSPDGLNSLHGHSLPVQLRQQGFSAQLITDLREVWQNQPAELGRRAFMQSLAVRLAAREPGQKLRSRILCITGSSGSGKTMLAAKIAGWSRAEEPGRPLILGSLSETQTTVPDSLRAFGRMMNLPCQQLQLADFTQSLQETSKRLIIDVSTASEAVLDQLAQARRTLGKDKISFLHCVPGGTSAKMIHHQGKLLTKLSPDIALTKLDECETAPQEFSALAENRARIGVLTGTKSLIGAIAFASEAILAQYLNENC